MQITTHFEHISTYKRYLMIKTSVEKFLIEKGYLPIDLPVLSPALVPESYLEVFETEFRYLNKKEKLYLTPSPELFLKRILVYCKINCFYLGKSFRNSEPDSSLHCPEFTMLEFYKLHADYFDIANELLNLLKTLAHTLNGSDFIVYRGNKVSFTKWEKLSISEAFMKYAKISEKELFDKTLLMEKARSKGYNISRASYEDVFSQIYVQEVEPHLGKNGYPTLIYDYPKEFAALAKLNEDKKTAQRFEFYIEGVELGDCYTELTDWKEQKERFQEEEKLRHISGKIEHPKDDGFIEALKHGLEPCAGIAIGFDRLAMIFADVTSIDKLKLIQVK